MSKTEQQASFMALIMEEIGKVRPSLAETEFRPDDELSVLGLDSADVIELVGGLEDRLDIEILDEDVIDRVRTFADLIDVLGRYRDGN